MGQLTVVSGEKFPRPLSDMMPITTHEGHLEALREIDSLGDLAPGTELGDRLDALVNAVVAYELIHYPIGDENVGQEA